jgi:hypothetical protein
MDALVVIYCDNINSILLANNQFIMLRQSTLMCTTTLLKKILTKEVDLIDVSIEGQVANIFTKVLGIDKLRKFLKMFGVLEMDLSSKRNVENSTSTS